MVGTDYGSRKYIVTMSGMAMCFLLAAGGMFTNTDPSPSALLGIGAGIGAYNWANVKWKNGSKAQPD